MARKVSITKENIIEASIKCIKEMGYSNLSVRNVSKILNCSIQPIFYNFATMDSLKTETLKRISEDYSLKIKEYIKTSSNPPYKASGLFYIKYAIEEPELFKALFMRDSSVDYLDQSELFDSMADVVNKTTDFSLEEARKIHFAMWTVVHGMAVMCVTNYLKIDLDMASETLSNVYLSLIGKKKIC